MRLSLSLLCLLVALVSTGCKTTISHVRWQHEPARSASEVARLKIPRSVFGINVLVNKINGEPLLKEPEKVRNWVKDVDLLPGKYELMVGMYFPDGSVNGVARSLADIPVNFTAEAGKVYQLYASTLERTFGKSMQLALSGGTHGWTAWIVETNSGTVVGGVPRETPRKWHEK